MIHTYVFGRLIVISHDGENFTVVRKRTRSDVMCVINGTMDMGIDITILGEKYAL